MTTRGRRTALPISTACRPMHPLNQGFLRKGHEVCAAARFTAMYHRWLKHGDAVFAGPSSPAIAEALNSGRGRVKRPRADEFCSLMNRMVVAGWLGTSQTWTHGRYGCSQQRRQGRAQSD